MAWWAPPLANVLLLLWLLPFLATGICTVAILELVASIAAFGSDPQGQWAYLLVLVPPLMLGPLLMFACAHVCVRGRERLLDPKRWRDRHLRSGRCPRCRYNIRGLPEQRCPECGETWKANAVRCDRSWP